MELHDVSYGIEYVARPLLLFFSFENQLLWFRHRYAVSSLMDTAYWSSEYYRLGVGNSTTMGREKSRAAAKNKGSKASGSSTMNDNALARLVVNELTTAEVQQREAFIEIKNVVNEKLQLWSIEHNKKT
ncbi:hypothetical protein Tco_0360223 [Tanacetum coccineum]